MIDNSFYELMVMLTEQNNKLKMLQQQFNDSTRPIPYQLHEPDNNQKEAK